MIGSKDFVDKMMDYESGELNDNETLELFSIIVKCGYHTAMQGHYGRVASSLMDMGLLDTEGNIIAELD
jgi:hypothetical protein